MPQPPSDKTLPPDDPTATFRRGVYGLLIAVSFGAMLGRVLAVNSVDTIQAEKVAIARDVAQKTADLKAAGKPVDAAAVEKDARRRLTNQRPFLSGNDRSRWDTIRSLVEQGTYEIDDIQNQNGWDTIDMVQHLGPDGKPHLYSSKPTLLTTILAGEYWLIYHVTGASLGDHPYEVGRFMLVTFNVVPLAIMFLLLARLVEKWGRSDWGRVLIMAAATLGTLLTTFAIVLNNHVTAAVTATAAIYATARIWYDGRRELRYFALAGLMAALTAADELPALSFLVALSAGLLWKAPRQTLIGYLPPVLLVTAGFFGTNYLAHQSLRPAYMHRKEVDLNSASEAVLKEALGISQESAEKIIAGRPYKSRNDLQAAMQAAGVLQATNDKVSPEMTIADPSDNWYHFQYMRGGRLRTSYWSNPDNPLDRGEPSVAKYAFHALIGGHGIFSLTPIWLLAIPGIFLLGWGRDYRLRDLALLIGSVTVVCLIFYIFLVKPLDRNYGGMSSGFRWVFWMAPLWLLAALPAADWLAATRWRRGVGYVLLALSVLSASYPTWNPWISPWLSNFFVYLGWAKY